MFCVSDEVLEQDGFGPSCQSPVDLAAAQLLAKGECRVEIMRDNPPCHSN